MTPLLSLEAFLERVPASAFLVIDQLPAGDQIRIVRALEAATGEIVAHLPWLLGEDGEIIVPLPPQWSDALKAACTDIAFFRITDRVSSSEDDRERYKAAVRLIEKVATEYQGGLMGPDLQAAQLVEPNETEGILDHRFFRKGEML